MFFGSLLGVLFGHFSVFVAPSFFKPFWGPPRGPQIIVFLEGRWDAGVVWLDVPRLIKTRAGAPLLMKCGPERRF